MKNILKLSVLLIMFVSCSSDSEVQEEQNNIPELDTSIKLISSTYKEDNNSPTKNTTYEYNNSGQLIKRTIKSYNTTVIENYIYIDNKISKIEYSNGDYHNFYYSNGKITSSRQLKNGLIISMEYNYDSKGRLTKVDNDNNGVTTYTYDGDNIIKRVNKTNTFINTHDNKYNPYYLLFKNTGIPYAISKNNIKRSEQNNLIIHEYSLEYNSNNLPVKKTYKYTPLVETYTYSK